MRKKRIMALSLILVMLQIVALLAIIPASAAAPRRYAIYKTETAPLLNGQMDAETEAWNNVPWSESFRKTTGDKASGDFSAKFKMMWSENTEKNMIDLWFFVFVEDSTATGYNTSNWQNDYFALSILSGGKKLYSNGRVEIGLLPAWENRVGNAEYADESTKNETVASYAGVDVDLGWQDKRATDGYYTFEYMVSIPADKIVGNLSFDVMINDHTNKTTGTNEYSRNAWNFMNDADFATPTGTGIMLPISAGVAESVPVAPYNSYDIYKAAAAPTENDWAKIKWSEGFEHSGGTQNDAFGANFKALWVDNGDTVDLWFYVRVKDADATQKSPGASWWTDDYVTVSVDVNRDGDTSDTGEIDSGFRAELENIGADGKITYYTRNITFTLDDKRSTEGYYVMTMCIPVTKASIVDNTFNFDIMANNCGSSSQDVYTRISWDGMNNTSAIGTGIGRLSDKNGPSAEAIYTLTGAGTRLDTPAGLRFESRINKAYYDALPEGAEVTVGTIIVPTDYLEAYGINNKNFTKAALDDLGIVYLDVVNSGWANAATADSDGYYKYYGSIVGIKEENLDREFSGIGYMTVKTADGEYTVYGGYTAEDHSRSVSYVASKAIASGEYNDYLDILQVLVKAPAESKQ